MRAKNFILLTLVCICAFGILHFGNLDLNKKISLEILDLFPQNKDREMIELYRQIGDSSLIFLSPNENQSAQEFEAFLSQVGSLPNIKEIITDLNPNFQKFLKKYYFFLGNLDTTPLSSAEMEQKILQNQNNLNPLDPLGLIQIPQLQTSLTLYNRPLILIKIKDSNAAAVEELYNSFAPLAERFGIKHYYSPLFVDVHNPQLILQEVNTLALVAAVFFVLLYFLILRIPFLTLNSIATILLSNIIAIVSLLLIYPQVSIMSLSFGIGISNICIDYMMHHHFLGFYTHKKISFNSSVFYGFLTTIVGFLVCLFIPFPLLNQLAIYAIINLSVAYLCFSFLYQSITFAPPKYFDLVSKMQIPLIPAWLFLLLSLVFGGYALRYIQKDLDLSKLDYQNQVFNAQKDFFAPFLSEKTFLIQAANLDSLISKAKEIAKISPSSAGILGLLPTKAEIESREKYFKSLAFARQKQNFKKALHKINKHHPALAQMLKNSYAFPLSPKPQITFENLEHLGLEIFKKNHSLYFQGRIQDLAPISHISSIYTQQIQDLMQNITSGIFTPMLLILSIAFIAIILLLLILTGKHFLDSLTFILLPISCTLFYLSLTTPINIMHLFALLLIVVVGIDYGIYHVKEKDEQGAKHAVLFSTLTTLCSFGLFMLSKTKALSSFGEVVVIGMSCILLLIFFQKDWIKQ